MAGHDRDRVQSAGPLQADCVERPGHPTPAATRPTLPIQGRVDLPASGVTVAPA